MGKNLVRVKVSKEVLEDALPIPKGTKIIACSTLDSMGDAYFTFLMEADGIPEREEGCLYPEASLILESEDGKIVSSKFELFKEFLRK